MSEEQQQAYPGGPQPQGSPGAQGYYGAQAPYQTPVGGVPAQQAYQGSMAAQAAYAGPPPVGAQMKRRSVFAVWLGLPIITLGIYSLVWYYKIHSEMKSFDPRETKINPAGSLLTMMFGSLLCGIPPLVSFYNTGTRIANAQRAAGLPQTCAPALGLVLGILFGAGTLYYQSELNKIVAQYGNVPAGGPVQLAA
jgi:hypothetical protein